MTSMSRLHHKADRLSNPDAPMSEAKKWLSYYRTSLSDADRMGRKRPNESIVTTNLYAEEVREQCSEWFSEPGPEPQEWVQIQVAPFRLSRPARSGKPGRSFFVPFWIPALLGSDGTLHPPEGHNVPYPWFVRESLAPYEHPGQFPICGTLEGYDQAISVPYDVETWEDQVAFANSVFKAVTDQTIADFEADGYVKSLEWTIERAEVTGVSKSVSKLYEQFVPSDVVVPPLVRALIDPPVLAQKSTDLPEIDVFLCEDHLGQMSDDYPLSPSQREAISSFGRTKPAEVLAINGPPGTGKTTLLRSIVADGVVRGVVDDSRDGTPFTILASSTNNQAITNILDNFASATSSDPLSKRWLPVSPSYGMYLPSNAKFKLWNESRDGYPAITVPKKKLEPGSEYPALDGFDYEAWRQTYLEHARVALADVGNTFSDTKVAIAWLESEIDRLRNGISDVVRAAKSMAPLLDEASAPGASLSGLIEGVAEALRQRVADAETLCDTTAKRQDALNAYLADEPFLLQLFRWIPAVRKRRVARVRGALANDIERDVLFRLTAIEELERKLAEDAQHAESQRDAARLARTVFLEDRVPLDTLVATVADKGWASRFVVSEDDRDPVPWYRGIADALDVTYRYRLFCLSSRLQEARWLDRVSERMESKFRQFGMGRKGRASLFTEMAYLTPLFISTCHSVARFLRVSERLEDSSGTAPQFRDVYSEESFDVVVMDEAGQVSPEIGLAPFFFGRRAIVVGDAAQIEPVWSIHSRRIDAQNLSINGVVPAKTSDEVLTGLSASGRLCSDGSVMKMAQRATVFGQDRTPRGLMLTEHRRCVDELIGFCNRNVYGGSLRPMTGTIESARAAGHALSDLPALGYAHIRGYSTRKNGSRRNVTEAKAVARFLETWGDRLKEVYPKTSIGEIVAVVTPFRAQKEEIEAALDEIGFPHDDLTVGTVHSLQGAERPVVLFSPTYGSNDLSSSLFFDNSFNMLNVAISRAKYHFVVIGDVRVFRNTNHRQPSGALGAMLFAAPSNEINTSFHYSHENPVDPESLAPLPTIDGVRFKRISTLEEHRDVIRRSIANARTRVIIVSPFISIRAIESDHLESLVRDAIEERGVTVRVFTDDRLDYHNGTLKDSSREGRESLVRSGAEVNICAGIHNKAIAIDDRILIEGSFNWLSATRDPGSPHARRDVSVAVFELVETVREPDGTDSADVSWGDEKTTGAVVARNIASLISEMEPHVVEKLTADAE